MTTGDVVLLIPGQGAQYPGMAVDRHRADPAFAADIDEFFALMGPRGAEIRTDWLAEHPVVPIDDASRAQPLLFALGYAHARSLMRGGVDPTVLIGHSVGELVAACLAEVFDLATAAAIMNARLSALADIADGGMVAVAASAATVEPFLVDGVVVGAVNAPMQTVVSGARAALDEVVAAMTAAGLVCFPVPALQPFHSPAAAGPAALFTAGIAGLPLHAPRRLIQSTVTAEVVTGAEARRPDFWAEQIAQPVVFWPAVDAVLSDPGLLGDGFVVVEAGEGKSLSSLVRRHKAMRSGRGSVLRPGELVHR
ncbi:acyltransferase domain-containing protein [Actinokineospora enzanensis]|uniref:acyltransferase domain-containing protein n=1 Tax=Actinokineospora enzanensis TaxID=155975 RepID=UPI00035CBF2E|nr:acyltransferase domain-containing protein [Actinokineospora enzanensis]